MSLRSVVDETMRERGSGLSKIFKCRTSADEITQFRGERLRNAFRGNKLQSRSLRKKQNANRIANRKKGFFQHMTPKKDALSRAHSRKITIAHTFILVHEHTQKSSTKQSYAFHT